MDTFNLFLSPSRHHRRASSLAPVNAATPPSSSFFSRSTCSGAFPSSLLNWCSPQIPSGAKVLSSSAPAEPSPSPMSLLPVTHCRTCRATTSRSILALPGVHFATSRLPARRGLPSSLQALSPTKCSLPLPPSLYANVASQLSLHIRAT